MKKKTIYLASDSHDDNEDFTQKAFETEQDVIDFCKRRNIENSEHWGWHAITYYYR